MSSDVTSCDLVTFWIMICLQLAQIVAPLGFHFFPSVAADFALRLGPNNAETKIRPSSDNPQISRPDLRFASKKHTEETCYRKVHYETN